MIEIKAKKEIKYRCQTCGKTPPSGFKSMLCKCGGFIRGTGGMVPIGTRDNFGIGKSFRDERSGKTIDNWKSWEKAGYRKPRDVITNHNVVEKAKEKTEKIKKGFQNADGGLKNRF